MDERKPIDYLHEPVRQEILDLIGSLDRTKKRITDIKKVIEREPDRLLTTSDLESIYSVFLLQSAQMSIILYQVTGLHVKYFQGLDSSK